ncbi:phage terminase large subunit family protein [Burkholderia sp. S-53]|uniref:phage terminase large subunit family protein n=1 Tax=Burkholderia sp. S-53 TaxID=2906514 RepID=UPI00298BE72D|nr:phage terminase large subunit family protein [Burkholderia sp. S-53]
MGGTPTVDGLSRIQQAYAASDRRVHVVPRAPCPDCDEEHELAWENVTWSEDADVVHEVYGRARPESARYTCPRCGSLWTTSCAFVRYVADDRSRRRRFTASQGFESMSWYRLSPARTWPTREEVAHGQQRCATAAIRRCGRL